jgi:hypothetical protein
MKKYINTKTGKEVKVGDKFKYEEMNANARLCFECNVTLENIMYLNELGFIKEVIINDNQELVDFYLEKIAIRKNWSLHQTKEYFTELLSIYPKAFKDCLYRVISIEWRDCDLRKLKSVFGIGCLSANKDQAVKISTSSIVRWQNGAFFKTKEEAELAICIVDRIIKTLNEEQGKQKD